MDAKGQLLQACLRAAVFFVFIFVGLQDMIRSIEHAGFREVPFER